MFFFYLCEVNQRGRFSILVFSYWKTGLFADSFEHKGIWWGKIKMRNSADIIEKEWERER